jgi:hypothetical protein
MRTASSTKAVFGDAALAKAERDRALVGRWVGARLALLAAQHLVYRMTDDLPDRYRLPQADFDQAKQQLEGATLARALMCHSPRHRRPYPLLRGAL